MQSDQLSCQVPVHYSKRDEEEKRLIYKDTFLISPKEGYDSRNQDIMWEGRWDAYIINVLQKHHHADIEESDVTIVKNPDRSPDLSISVSFPKKEIAATLNRYIDNIFR